MKLSTHPFHPVSGDLLPAHRDAYLRGDLSGTNTEAVDAYIRANRHRGDETLRRYYELRRKGHQVRPVGWVQRQFELIQTEPRRLRRRAASLAAGVALVGGAVFAGTSLPTYTSLSAEAAPTFVDAADEHALTDAAEAGAVSTLTVKGRILDENGRPLVGATVLQKGSFRGVSTDRNGHYALRVPAGEAATLQFGYAGYTDSELRVHADAVQNVTLLPRNAQATAGTARKRFLGWF